MDKVQRQQKPCAKSTKWGLFSPITTFIDKYMRGSYKGVKRHLGAFYSEIIEFIKERGKKLDYCKRCGDTGQVEYDKFCTCMEGIIKQGISEYEKNEAAELETFKAYMQGVASDQEQRRIRAQDQILSDPESPYMAGDWVDFVDVPGLAGVSAYVLEVEKDRALLKLSRETPDFNDVGWMNNEHLKKAPPIAADPEITLYYIDLAISTGDEDWFNDLVLLLPKNYKGAIN